MWIISFAQSNQVTGIVSDETGEPLIGVNVLVEGNRTGTITDLDGKFIINVTPNAKVKFSFIGYTSQEVIIGNRKILKITLKENNKLLNEVVVVGYGTMKRSDLTGSVGSVESKNITAKGSTTLMESLQGQVAGVDISQSSSRPGESFNIQIRGKSSLESGSPLYVVDGIVTNSINFLNPADIEKIDILKDASSTAIYGSRATNGVVMVTTKSAKVHKGGKYISVNYDGYYGTKKTARMPDFMSGREWANYRLMRYTTAKINTDGSVTHTLTDGNLSSAWAGNSEKMKQMYEDQDFTDWSSLVTKTGSQQNHFLSIDGGNSDMSYRIGFGYQQEKGVMGETYERFNVKGAIDNNISTKVKSGLTVNLSTTNKSYGSENAIINGFRANPYWLPYDENGKLNKMPGKDSRFPTGFSSTINPLVDAKNSADRQRGYDVLANIYLQYSPIKEITLKTTLSPSYTYTRHGTWSGVDSEVNAKTGTEKSTLKNSQTFSWTWDNQISIDKNIGEHHFNALGVFSLYQVKSETDGMTGVDFPFTSEWYNMGAASEIQDPYSSYSKISMESFIARINYSYKGRYMATVSSRWDGSSKFQKGHRWGMFPSVALAWRMSEESFLKDNANWLDNLKLRLSYGVTGNNAGVGAYTTQALASTKYWYGLDSYYGFGPAGFVNEALSWEKTYELNAGLDFSFFNSRINGSVDVYNRTSKDLLMQQKVLEELGSVGGSMWNNVGKVRNRGIEISLNTVNVNVKDWRWQTSFTFSSNQNKILELNDKKEDDVADKWFIGHPIDVEYELAQDGVCTAADLKANPELYTKYGFFEGSMKIKDQQKEGTTGYGVIDSNDRVIQGHEEPNWIGSFNSTLNYKNWDFSFSIFTKQGCTVASPFIQEFTDYSDRGRNKLHMDFYVPEGSPTLGGLNSDGSTIINTKAKSGAYPYPTNDQTNHYGGGFGWGTGKHKTYYSNKYVNASFVKIKNITLGYTLPECILKTLHVSNLRVYANVLNPFTITNYKGFDPEWASASISDGTGGPSTVTYQFGVNIKF